METEFAVTAWAAHAPGLHSPAQWRAWAAQPCLPVGELDVALPNVSALLRRRLSPLGRIVVKAAFDAAPEPVGAPIVFASRYGDAERAIGVLRQEAMGQAVSPADFALSVHNAIGALYSIARKDVGGYTALAAGPASAAAAFVEAIGLLADGEPEVLVVNYDAGLPTPYDRFADEPGVPYAWAWNLALPKVGQPRLRLASSCLPESVESDPCLPFGLEAMRFMASDTPELHCAANGVRWTWRRHG